MRRVLAPLLPLVIALLTACPPDDGDPAAPAEVCTPAALPSPVPAVAESPNVAQAKRIADVFMARHLPESLAWDWSEAVLLTSFVDLYRATGVAAYETYVRRYLYWHAEKGYSVLASDRAAPAIPAAVLYGTSCDERYKSQIDTVLKFLYEDALRTPEGAISHFGGSELFGITVWIDSLFMMGEVLIRWGETAKDPKALDQFALQFRETSKLLQDPSGFYTHASNWPGQDPGVFWARGNGWVLASGTDYLRVRKERGEWDPAVAASLTSLGNAVVATQDDASGLWWSVVNRPNEIYLETSASALFALGLARGHRIGLWGDAVLPVIARAMDGVRKKIVNDVVTDISGPTDAGGFQNYARVPLQSDVPFGVGATISALLETATL